LTMKEIDFSENSDILYGVETFSVHISTH